MVTRSAFQLILKAQWTGIIILSKQNSPSSAVWGLVATDEGDGGAEAGPVQCLIVVLREEGPHRSSKHRSSWRGLPNKAARTGSAGGAVPQVRGSSLSCQSSNLEFQVTWIWALQCWVWFPSDHHRKWCSSWERLSWGQQNSNWWQQFDHTQTKSRHVVKTVHKSKPSVRGTRRHSVWPEVRQDNREFT